jgi:molecular chaperone GrpE
MMRQPTDEHPPGTIVQEVVKGYRLRDRVIRPAKVVVAAAPTTEKGDREASAGTEKAGTVEKRDR